MTPPEPCPRCELRALAIAGPAVRLDPARRPVAGGVRLSPAEGRALAAAQLLARRGAVLTSKRVAAAVGVSAWTVGTLLRRARRKLRGRQALPGGAP